MNPVVLYFASGDSLYSGAGLLVIAIIISPFLQSRRALVLRNITGWLGLAMIVMASAPFTWMIHVFFYGSFAFWYLASTLAARTGTKAKVQLASSALLFTLLVVLSSSEFIHRHMPRIAGASADHLVVIGDSISSGIDPRAPTWPEILQQMTGIPVKNLARPGARTIDGLEMAGEISSADHVVLIEIGGNDLLSGMPSKEFERALDALLSKVAAPQRTVIMFELPLMPQEIAYGQIQRRLAAKYGIVMIPKRYFVDMIRGSGANSDGIHLSVDGARRSRACGPDAFIRT